MVSFSVSSSVVGCSSIYSGSLGIISPTVSSMAVRLADGTCTGTDGTMGVRAIDCATGTGWGV